MFDSFVNSLFVVRAVVEIIGTCGGLLFMVFLFWLCLSPTGVRLWDWFDDNFL